MLDEESSKRITSLRYILAVLVVIIHNNFTVEGISEYINQGLKPIIFNQSVFGKWIQLFFSDGLALCAVPLFFLFSAYLQVKKHDKYKILVLKKINSLVIPYFFWISLYLLYFTVGRVIISKLFPSILSNTNESFITWSFKDWIHYIFGYKIGTGGNPMAAGQLWFVRDLFIFVILSPLFIKVIEKLPVLFFSFILLFAILGKTSFDVHLPTALFYYMCGLYWGIYDIELFKKIDEIKWGEILALFFFCFIFKFFLDSYFSILLFLHIFTTCVLFLKFSKILISKNKIFFVLEQLSVYSFFLYAIHMPIMHTVVYKIWICLFPMKNTFFCLFEFFGVSLILIIIGTGLGFVIRKFFPKFFGFINGGRK